MSGAIFLVDGSSREHVTARTLAPDCDLYAYASNRNPGIATLAGGSETISETAAEDIVTYAESIGATLTIVSSESGLAADVADTLDEMGIYTFGPQAAGARIETSKTFQRQFMHDEETPGNPDFVAFDDTEAAYGYTNDYDGDLTVKPTDFASGRGVRIIGDQATPMEVKAYLRDLDYERVILEERLVGKGFTIQAFVADGEFRVNPTVRGYKRAYEGDEGPNIGGMGNYIDVSPSLPLIAGSDYEAAVEVIETAVKALPKYKDIPYDQFMLTTESLKVIEFNAHFGDPEVMNTLPVLETPFIDVLIAVREGESLLELDFTEAATICKYAVPEDYPTDPETGMEITAEMDENADVLLFYAGADDREDGLYTTTSRLSVVVGVADSITGAEELAKGVPVNAGEGSHIRHDIDMAALVQCRIGHMAEFRGE